MIIQVSKKAPNQEIGGLVAVVRDPRDLLVSWYYSMRNSHVAKGQVPRLRKTLLNCSEGEGLLYGIKHLSTVKVFDGMREWPQFPERKVDKIMVLKFEDMIGENKLEYFRRLLANCCIELSDKNAAQLFEDHDFKKKSGGRNHGVGDNNAHYRKGIAGDWRTKLNGNVIEVFKKETGDLVEALSYSWEE